MRRRISTAAAGGAVTGGGAWRPARGGSPGAGRRGRPAPPSRRAGTTCSALTRCSGDPSAGIAAPARSSSSRKRTAPSPTVRAARLDPRGERLGRERDRPEARAGARGGEHLAAAGVDDGHDRRGRRSAVAPRGERREARDADQRQPAGLGERAGGRDPDPQAGEAAGADADGDPLDGVPRRAGRASASSTSAQQARGVARAARRAPGRRGARRRPARRPDGDGGGGRGGVEAEDHATSIVRRSPPACASRTCAATRSGGHAPGAVLRPLDERDRVGREERRRAARGPRRPCRRGGRGRDARPARRRPS